MVQTVPYALEQVTECAEEDEDERQQLDHHDDELVARFDVLLLARSFSARFSIMLPSLWMLESAEPTEEHSKDVFRIDVSLVVASVRLSYYAPF